METAKSKKQLNKRPRQSKISKEIAILESQVFTFGNCEENPEVQYEHSLSLLTCKKLLNLRKHPGSQTLYEFSISILNFLSIFHKQQEWVAENQNPKVYWNAFLSFISNSGKIVTMFRSLPSRLNEIPAKDIQKAKFHYKRCKEEEIAYIEGASELYSLLGKLLKLDKKVSVSEFVCVNPERNEDTPRFVEDPLGKRTPKFSQIERSHFCFDKENTLKESSFFSPTDRGRASLSPVCENSFFSNIQDISLSSVVLSREQKSVFEASNSHKNKKKNSRPKSTLKLKTKRVPQRRDFQEEINKAHDSVREEQKKLTKLLNKFKNKAK